MTLKVSEQTGFPPTFLNAYINSELQAFDLMPTGPNPFQPFFPSQSPMNIEDVYNDSLYIRNNPDGIVVMFDRLIRFRPTPFYRHKREQLIYFIYGPNLSKLFDTTRVIIECLDREDAAAEDLNRWVSANNIMDENDEIITPNVFFHNIRVYQADEARDIAELTSARTLFLNKLVIEYDYHTTDAASQRYT